MKKHALESFDITYAYTIRVEVAPPPHIFDRHTQVAVHAIIRTDRSKFMLGPKNTDVSGNPTDPNFKPPTIKTLLCRRSQKFYGSAVTQKIFFTSHGFVHTIRTENALIIQ